jgi:predicted nucleic acid-binding protein
MTEVLADSFYYLALGNSEDEAHARAVAASRDRSMRHVTHAWVLTEVADALAPARLRRRFLELLRALEHDPRMIILPATEDLFRAGIRCYARRPDKDWSLTDCISFEVMQQRGIQTALTGDRHFVQAGFTALLR